MSEYRLDLDVPYTELEEFGWAKLRLMRDLPRAVTVSSKLFLERTTGTLMLRPIERDHATHIASREPLSNLNFAVGGWQEQNRFIGSVLTAPGPMARSILQPGTLVSTLVLGALNAVNLALSDTMRPVLQTKDTYVANQPIWFEIEMNGQPCATGKNVLGITFGQYHLVVHSYGKADLYESTGGTRGPDSWQWVRRFDGESSSHGRHVSYFVGGLMASPTTSLYGQIIPFGRGNILFMLWVGGTFYHGVYSQPEAIYNNGAAVYEISDAGTVILYMNGADAASYNIGTNIGKLKFETSGTWTDETFQMPYSPTVDPETGIVWSKTMGTPNVTKQLVKENGIDPFVSDGATDKWRMKLTLTGDGTCTPFVDAYKVAFPPKIASYNPAPFRAPLEELSYSDGENWDDQHCEVAFEARPTDATIRTIASRSEFFGKLSVDGAPKGLFLFRKPAVTYERHKITVKFTGKNAGVCRVQEKRFTFAPTYGGMTAPNAVKEILQLAGFLPSDIIIDADPSVILPATELSGQGKEGKETEIKSQPGFNTPVEQFLSWIREEFEPWQLRYGGDGKWRFQRPVIPTSAAWTFRPDRPRWNDWSPWYESPLTYEIEPPEANIIYLVGRRDNGELIANSAIDYLSGRYRTIGRPVNYLGRWRMVVLVNGALNDMDLLTTCLQTAFDRLRQAPIKPQWKGPWIPQLEIDDGVLLRDFGLVHVKGYETEGDSPKKLERSASTTYRGILLRPDVNWLPSLPAATTTHGRSHNERDLLVDKLSRRANDRGGGDVDVRSNTTGQRDEQEEMLKEIIRGSVTWGTPITVGS